MIIQDEGKVVDMENLVHLYPLFGPEHICSGFKCWCHPEPDPDDPELILHNVMH